MRSSAIPRARRPAMSAAYISHSACTCPISAAEGLQGAPESGTHTKLSAQRGQPNGRLRLAPAPAISRPPPADNGAACSMSVRCTNSWGGASSVVETTTSPLPGIAAPT